MFTGTSIPLSDWDDDWTLNKVSFARQSKTSYTFLARVIPILQYYREHEPMYLECYLILIVVCRELGATRELVNARATARYNCPSIVSA